MIEVQKKDDEPFRHYKTKHQIVAWISQTFFDKMTYTVRRGLIKGMKRRGGIAWLPEYLIGSAITPEQAFWMNENLKGLVIYDIGAFQGLLTLLFATRGKQVISYEPNTKNYERLIENLRLNGVKNVLVRKIGIGLKKENVKMVALPSMLGGASIEDNTVTALLNSSGTVLTEEVPVTTLDDDIKEMTLPAPDFIKIDIEGAELAALEGARNTLIAHHPLLFLEMHGETMALKRKNVAAVVACLNQLGYIEILHLESGARIRRENASVAAEGHLYCR